MWPSRHGLGVQLGYGLQGANYHSESLDQESPWKFARQRDGGLALTEVRFSKETLVPSQISDSDITTAKDNTFKSVLKDVPASLMDEIVKNEEFLSSEYVYDPTYSEMIDYSILKNSKRNKFKDSTEVIAYVSGPSGCTVNTHVVQRTKNFIMTKDQSFDLFIPTLGKGSSWEFDSPIKQIQIRQDSLFDSEHPHVLLIRTARSIHLLRLKVKITHSIETTLKLIGTVQPEGLYDESFAYVSSSPFDKELFLAVDIKGNWGLGRIKKKYISTFLIKGKIFDPDEISNFKRITWANDRSRIFVIGRTYVKEFHLKSLEKKDIISAGKWSEIRDYKRFPFSLNFSLLLTSKELILVDVSKTFRRVLTWKHYLDSDDPSLSLTVRPVGEITFVMIHSQIHPVIFIHQFKIDNDFPVSLRDPLMINTGGKVAAHGYTIVPAFFNDIKDPSSKLPPALTIFKISTQLEVSRVVTSTLENSLLLKYPNSMEISTKNQESSPLVDDKASLINRKVEKLQLLTDQVFGHLDEDTTDYRDDVAIFQEFASKLNFQTEDDRAPFSLMEFSDSIKGFQKFEEFDNLMEQLQDHCRDINLGFLSLSELNQHLLKNKTESISRLHAQLLKLWNFNNPDEEDELFTKYIARDLALSSSVIYNSEKEKSKAPELIGGLPKKLRNIISKWDEGFEEQEEEQTPSQFFETPEPVIKPIVTVSQSQTTTANSQGLLRPSQRVSQRAQSLISRPQQPASQLLSQTESSQPVAAASQSTKAKKKKRRIKGFG